MPALKRRRDPMPKSRKKERIMVAQTTGAVLNLRKKEYTMANPIDSANDQVLSIDNFTRLELKRELSAGGNLVEIR